MGVTIKDIAKAAGVSYSTVSKALRNSPLVNVQTKQKILRIAEQMGYQPNFVAKSLVSKKSNTIGVVWPTMERAALSALATKINAELEWNGYHMLLSINPIDTAVKVFNRFQVDAILVFKEQSAADTIKSNIPILFYGETTPSPHPNFNVNRRQAIKKALEYLYQLGHRQIAYIGDLSTENKNQQEKYLGFREGCTELKLSLSSTETVDTRGLGWQDGHRAALELLKSGFLPTAIIGGSYDVSLGVLRAIKEAKLNVPEHISLISYDNIPQAANLETPLTTVGTPIDKIATRIVRSLLQLIDGENISVPKLNAELVIRDSVKGIERPMRK